MSSAAEAVRGAEIIITATNARAPVLQGEWLSPGAHVNAVGSNRLESRELDDHAVERSGLIAVDSKEQAMIESGDLVEPAARGIISWHTVRELGAIVAGILSGRTDNSMITLFKSNGIAVQDIALAAFVYERARAQGIGKEIEL